MNRLKAAQILVPLLGILCLWPGISSGVALLIGLAVALTMGNPYSDKTKKLAGELLPLSVVGLGAAMDLQAVLQTGVHGIGYTLISLTLVFGFGFLIARMLKMEKITSILIIVGTAICGGSAIAAAGPVLRAKAHQMSVSLAIVFLLNAVALLIFPSIGHYFELTQTQFGLWSALAIHDTSSVVGASLQYGAKALEVGTSVKLARALWIVPLVLVLGTRWFQSSNEEIKTKPKRPWFILGFVLMAAAFTYLPAYLPLLTSVGEGIHFFATRLLVVTLFLIGSHLSLEAMKTVGLRPFILGISLWILTATLSLGAIVQGWLNLPS